MKTFRVVFLLPTWSHPSLSLGKGQGLKWKNHHKSGVNSALNQGRRKQNLGLRGPKLCWSENCYTVFNPTRKGRASKVREVRFVLWLAHKDSNAAGSPLSRSNRIPDDTHCGVDITFPKRCSQRSSQAENFRLTLRAQAWHPTHSFWCIFQCTFYGDTHALCRSMSSMWSRLRKHHAQIIFLTFLISHSSRWKYGLRDRETFRIVTGFSDFASGFI